MDKPADREDRLVDFAVRMINVVEALPSSKAGDHVAGQLIRSETAPARNYGEAQSAESRKDFIHQTNLLLHKSQIINRQSSIERESIQMCAAKR